MIGNAVISNSKSKYEVNFGQGVASDEPFVEETVTKTTRLCKDPDTWDLLWLELS